MRPLLLVLGFILITTSAYAAPAITGVTGTVSHGNVVTVNGSGFGTKSPVAPYLYDSFESGTVGNTITTGTSADIGTWGSNGTSWDPVYSSTNCHRGSRCSYLIQRSDDRRMLEVTGLNSTTLFMDFWMYQQNVSGNSDNWKPWNMWNYTGGRIEFLLCYYETGGAAVLYDQGGSLNQNNWDVPTANNSWQHHKAGIIDSTPGTADGRIHMWLNETAIGYNSDAVRTRDTSLIRSNISIGELWQFGNSNGGADLYVDNVYIDTTWARVEICNASAYASATHCEIQIPTTTWNANQLQITVNQGSFADSSSAYLYVADSTGTFNNSGYAVTFESGGGDTTAPTITAFTMPSTASSTTVSVSSFTATDAVGVTGYCITTTNSSSGCSWSGSAPTTATGSAGANTWYAWAKDAAGNVSTASTAATTITLPSTTTAHVNGHINGSLK